MKIKKVFFLLTVLFTSACSPAFADTYKIPELEKAISNITDTITWIIETLLILIIIGFGIQFILTADNPQERSRLKMKIIWAIVGLFIIFTAHPIVTWLQAII